MEREREKEVQVVEGVEVDGQGEGDDKDKWEGKEVGKREGRRAREDWCFIWHPQGQFCRNVEKCTERTS